MAERIISVLSGRYKPSEKINQVVDENWGLSDLTLSVTSIDYKLSDSKVYVSDRVTLIPGIIGSLNVYTALVSERFPDKFNTISTLNNNPVYPVNVDTDFGELTLTFSTDSISDCSYYGLLPWVDTGNLGIFNHVYRYDEKPIVPSDQRFIAGSSNFNFSGEEINFTPNFVDPINYDLLKTRMSPVNQISKYPWSRTKFADIIQDLKWGYGLNNFLVGGSVNTYYPVDPEAVTPPPEPPVSQEVITFVNIVNIVKLPERTPIQFDNLQMSYDIDSIAWTVGFDIMDKATFNLIKPTKTNVVELEININGELFIVFIGKTNTTNRVDDSGKVQRRIKCQGWTVHKLLTHPYHARRSHVETSQSTPSGILDGELTGTGFTGTWDTVSWTIPANTYTYVDKTPLAALSELIQSVGAVVVPNPTDKSFSIKSRYPVSPWNWSGIGADINLHENSCFTIDTEWLPQESPDSIYCYGESSSGVAIKIVRAGQPGTKSLPTVISKYFTDSIPAAERGRVEIATHGYKEIVPITTYVNPSDGIIQPLQIVQMTEPDNVTTWKGQVVGVGLSLKRNGNALVQTIQLERHYDI